MLSKKWHIDIEKHPDCAKVKADYFAGKITNEGLMEAMQKMKRDLVKPGYYEYCEKKRQRELKRMFG
jgi:hypothetical protein